MAGGISVYGFPGVSEWPNLPLVSHEAPVGGVTISSASFNASSYITAATSEGVVGTFTAVGGVIQIPSSVFSRALADRLLFTLYPDGQTVNPAYIKFMPEVESVVFNNPGYIASTGELLPYDKFDATDFVAVEGVSEIVVSGLTNGLPLLYAYNASQGPVGNLVFGTNQFTSVHVVPDGSYKYVRASASIADKRSLQLHYADATD